ncbi:MAG TPA: ATPase, partial [Deltaproteobacteria bacterium]|nr:ATPase [Deltaproteobacteria bacterium]
LEDIIAKRRTIGGYFDKRITSPHQIIGSETDYLFQAHDFNPDMP